MTMAKVSSSLADNLGKNLECSVCLEQYTDPRVLPCLHTFCTRCLKGLNVKRDEDVWKIICPNCRSDVEIPQGNFDLLPVNFFVNNLLSVVALHEDSTSSSLECDNCLSGDPPVNRCTTCSHFLCEFCTQGHQRGRATRSHRLISLEEAKNMGSMAVMKPLICQEHEGEVLKLFCKTCEEAICRDCTIVKHRNHKYTFVKDAFSESKKSLISIKSETKTKVPILQEALDAVLEMKRNVQSCAEHNVNYIIECFESLSARLDARRGELIEEVDKIKKAKLKSLEIQEEELETALGSVQSSVEFIERAFENGSEVEILNMRKQMARRLQDLNSVKWQLEPCVDDALKFKDDSIRELDVGSLGAVTDVVTCAAMSTVTMGNGQEGVMYNTLCNQEIKFTVTARERNGQKRTEGGDSVVVVCHLDDPEGPGPNLVEVHSNGFGAYIACCTPKHEGCHKLSVEINGRRVRGSPFTWFVKRWHLERLLLGNSEGQIQFSDENLTAEYQVIVPPENWQSVFIGYSGRYGYSGQYTSGFESGYDHEVIAEEYEDQALFYTNPQHPHVNRKSVVICPVVLDSGRHMWQFRLFCINFQDLCLGVRSTGSGDPASQLDRSWLRVSGYVKSLHGDTPLQQLISNIKHCLSGDIIEMYLNCEDGTLRICNSRTKQSETLYGVEGAVCPVFCMNDHGDKVSLQI